MQEERVERARERAHELRGFYSHLTVYILVNLGLVAGLFIINWITSPDTWWFFWPLIGTGLGWGVAILIHAASVFGGGSIFGQEWEERKTRELLDREQPDP